MVQNGNTEASQALANFWPKVGEDVKTLTNVSLSYGFKLISQI